MQERCSNRIKKLIFIILNTIFLTYITYNTSSYLIGGLPIFIISKINIDKSLVIIIPILYSLILSILILYIWQKNRGIKRMIYLLLLLFFVILVNVIADRYTIYNIDIIALIKYLQK